MSMPESIAAARLSGPERQADGAAVFEFRFSPDDPTFAGHFPGRPMLPGVFQLEMARAAAEWTLGCALAVREVCKAKFLRPISPVEIVRLDLRLNEADGLVQAQAGFSIEGKLAGQALLRLWRSE